jgi:SAM-dependent methyltransferase
VQKKQREWVEQWSRFKDDTLFLFQEWIHPRTLEDFRGATVLDAGCGHGHHLMMVAPYAKEAVGVDLNTDAIARTEVAHLPNVRVQDGDIAKVSFPHPFDVVYSIGVIHHTDDPRATFENLKRLTRHGGLLIVWVYSWEGNWWNRVVLEGLKRKVLLRLPAGLLLALSYLAAILLYPPVWTVYFLPLRGVLPYHEYFSNFRKLRFRKNVQNIFDKLIAPQTAFLRGDEVRAWFDASEFHDVHVSAYKGVSWRASGVKR